MTRIAVLAGTLAVSVGLAGCSGSHHATSPTLTVRFGVIASGGGAELPQTLITTGIAAKYHLRVVIVPYATPGQQYTLVRGGGADVVPGNVLDLQRQRLAGLAMHGFAGFQRFSSPLVVRPGSALTSFGQLAHARVGEFGPTTIDWLAMRAAGLKADHVDLAGSPLTQSSPALLKVLLGRGRIDATLQFASLAAGPVAQGTERVLTTVPQLLRTAGFDADSLDVVWDLTDAWASANSGGLSRLRRAMTEAYARLRTGNPQLWAPLVKLVGITNPLAAMAFVDEEVANIDPPFDAALLAPTQQLIAAIVAVAGEKAVGFTTLPAADFWFPG